MTERLFFELIGISLGYKETMSRQPSPDEWQELFRMAKEQAVAGVCFAGVKRLKSQGVFPSDKLYMEWLSLAVMIQQRNELMNKWTEQLCRSIEKDGFDCCVLKGQSLAQLYGKELGLLRQSGDIDVWMLASHKKVVQWGLKESGICFYDYHHADLMNFHDVEVELHYRPTLSRNLWRNARLQRWFKQKGNNHIDKTKSDFPVPNYLFNLILVLNHNFWHLFYEGVGMRQMMDLYFVLCRTEITEIKQNQDCPLSPGFIKKHKEPDSNVDIRDILKYFGLLKFAAACMWVMQEVFGLSEDRMVCKPNEMSGRFLLHEILLAGNFGHFDSRLKHNRYGSRLQLFLEWTKHNWRLFSYYPADVLWTPIGILFISLWRRWHYSVDGVKLQKKNAAPR